MAKRKRKQRQAGGQAAVTPQDGARPANAAPAAGAPQGVAAEIGTLLFGLFFVGLFGWAFLSSAGEVLRIVTTGSNCPKRHCVSWAIDPGGVTLALAMSGFFALFSGGLLTGGLWALIKKAAADPADRGGSSGRRP